jgi:hypothetical protein
MYNLVEKVREGQTRMEQGLCRFKSSSKKTKHSIKQGYNQNFNISLFIITFVKTCYNVNIDHFYFFFANLFAKYFFSKGCEVQECYNAFQMTIGSTKLA